MPLDVPRFKRHSKVRVVRPAFPFPGEEGVGRPADWISAEPHRNKTIVLINDGERFRWKHTYCWLYSAQYRPENNFARIGVFDHMLETWAEFLGTGTTRYRALVNGDAFEYRAERPQTMEEKRAVLTKLASDYGLPNVLPFVLPSPASLIVGVIADFTLSLRELTEE